VLDKLPATLLRDVDSSCAESCVEAIYSFCSGVLTAVAPHVPCVKLQSACFERYLWPGVEAYHRLVDEARELGLMVIADAKRGDIGISAEHYAAGCLAEPTYEDLGELAGPDALTINSYLGADSLEPFVQTAREQGKGLFVLVRTSNPGGDALQSLRLADGRCVSDAVGQMVADLGEAGQNIAACGYSLLGAVVGATRPADAARLRLIMPRQIFLVPGYGAQGGGVKDVLPCFNDKGQGALITASRSVLYAFAKKTGQEWRASITAAAREMKEEVAHGIGW
jgi:orotidine-5'-phosphate decarboxylase